MNATSREGQISIELFAAPGCTSCTQAREGLRRVAVETGKRRVTWRDVNVLEELDYAVALGIVSPPSLAIAGELVFPVLPTPARLREELARRLANRT